MIAGMNHITLAVTDIEKAFHFYKEVLGFKPLVKWEGGAYFLIEKEGSDPFWFCLDRCPNRELTHCSTHYAFSVSVEDFETIANKVKASGAEIYKENKSEGKSLYFLDLDGHKLELHVGGWKDRIAHKRKEPGNWKNGEWFI